MLALLHSRLLEVCERLGVVLARRTCETAYRVHSLRHAPQGHACADDDNGVVPDQVYMMDKRYLDPRRPVGPPSAEDKAEGLVPYEPELPLAPQLFMTHRHTVANLAGASSLLPSHHCAVLCAGKAVTTW